MEEMGEVCGCPYSHLRSTLGSRDSRNCVSWLGAHLLDLSVHEAPLQERAWVQPTNRSLPRAQVGTIDS